MTRWAAWLGLLMILVSAVLVYGGVAVVTYRMAPMLWTHAVHPEEVQVP